jgi:hypothetical protein
VNTELVIVWKGAIEAPSGALSQQLRETNGTERSGDKLRGRKEGGGSLDVSSAVTRRKVPGSSLDIFEFFFQFL